MPIFFGLFYTVRGLTRRTGEVGLRLGNVSTVDSIDADYIPVLNARVFNPDFIGKDTEMYRDLSVATEMSSLGMDLARTPWNVLTSNFAEGLPYLLLVLLVGLSAWYQQRMIQTRSSSMSEMPAQQQLLMKYMPFMLPIFSFGFPAALVFYFLTSNGFRVLTQLFITRKYYGENADTSEIVQPTKEMVESVQKQKTAKSIDQSDVHGTRRHLTNPPKKRNKKTKPQQTSSPKKGKVAERKEPQARPTSKRVTPKKNNEQDTPGSRRRNKKKK
jgi:YidC/Oxa1 family membrane protein insertase